MSTRKPLANMNGLMDFVKKSNYPLTPVYEAITNSLEAISERSFLHNETPKITISLYFGGMFEETKELERIDVEDNGVGFTDENYNRYFEFFDKSKGYDNRGSGRLQLLHRFQRIEVNSIYLASETKYHRKFTCNSVSFPTEESNVIADDSEITTRVSMIGCSSDNKEKEYFDGLTIGDFVNDIRSKYLLRFYLDSQKPDRSSPVVTVVFYKNNTEIARQILTPKEMPSPQSTGAIKVPYMKAHITKSEDIEWVEVDGRFETIHWAHFTIPESELTKNKICLCSKDIPIHDLPMRHMQLRRNESINGNRLLTAFYGAVLDKPENVSHTVDSFKFPEKKEIEKKFNDMFVDKNAEYLFFDTIKDKVNTEIATIYKDITDLHKNKEIDIENIAKAHGIPSNIAAKAKINLTDDEKTITEKIYKEQASRLAETGYEVKKLYESLKELNPASPDYQTEIESKTIKLSSLVDQQNKEELSRYIIRREMVTAVLKKIIGGELDYQISDLPKGKNKDREGIIHDLIIKRKSNNTETLNDLWILDEEFVHFDGCSDLPIDSITLPNNNKLLRDISQEEIQQLGIKTDKRPDIFLFPGEGKCVLIELKQPETDLSDHLQQLPKYCQLIANYSTVKFDRFYCYLIGEKINPLLDLNEYEETVMGDWIRHNIPIRSVDSANRATIATTQIEVIKLSSIHARAHRRNQSFADKLGLPDLLAPYCETELTKNMEVKG